MKRLIFGLALLPGVAAAQSDEWKPNCPDFNAVTSGAAILSEDETPKLRFSYFMGTIHGYNLAMGTDEKSVTFQEIRTLCAGDPNMPFEVALHVALSVDGDTP